jgi:hypothetical protein
MQPIEPESNDNNAESANNYAKYTAVVFQMAAVIGLFTYAGYKIDQYFKHDMQWVTAITSLSGVCLSIFLTIKQLKK